MKRHAACGDCAARPVATSRRRVLGRISGTLLAAMAGVELSFGGDAVYPVAKATGAAQGADELSYPLPSVEGVTIDRDQQVIVVLFQRHVYAFNLACPHENTALRWKARDSRFQCPRHESKYEPDGRFVSGRATRNMDRFAIRRSGETLVVDLARLFRSDEQPADWAAATLEL